MVRIKNRSAMAMMILSAAVFPKTSLAAMDGTSEAKAFTHIGMANNPSTPKGTYHWFNLSGRTFQTYVEADGSVVILRDVGGSAAADLPPTTSWSTALTRFILPTNVLAELDDINRLRLYTGHDPAATPPVPPSGVLLLDAVTSDATLIARVKINKTLQDGNQDGFSVNDPIHCPTCNDVDDNGFNANWTDTVPGTPSNSQTLSSAVFNCKSRPYEDLSAQVFWGCGNVAMAQLIPYKGDQEPKNDNSLGSSQYYSLSVRAPSKPIPVATYDTSRAEIETSNKLIVTKTASPDNNLDFNDEVTYTYVITNYTADMITNISMSDVHNGEGSFEQPNIEAAVLTEGSATGNVAGDSYDLTTSDDKWDALAPGDSLTVTTTYTVTEADIE